MICGDCKIGVGSIDGQEVGRKLSAGLETVWFDSNMLQTAVTVITATPSKMYLIFFHGFGAVLVSSNLLVSFFTV